MSSAAAVSLGRQPCSRYRAVEQEHAKLVLKLTDTLTDELSWISRQGNWMKTKTLGRSEVKRTSDP
ncbi:hypothetical protein [Sinorhizobium medicae]